MLINKKAVKELLLSKSKDHHGERFTRVSAPVYLEVEARLTKIVDEFIKDHPQTGKTIMVYEQKEVDS